MAGTALGLERGCAPEKWMNNIKQRMHTPVDSFSAHDTPHRDTDTRDADNRALHWQERYSNEGDNSGTCTCNEAASAL